jgi:ligand-binding SRPBCC domain-containing protein
MLAGSGEPTDGQLVDMRIWLLGFIPVRWRARICQVTPPFGFTDQAEKSPFKFWRHRHDFIPDSGGTRIREIVAYIVMGGKPGMAINKWFVRKSLDRLFAHRQKVMQERFGGASLGNRLPEDTLDNR